MDGSSSSTRPSQWWSGSGNPWRTDSADGASGFADSGFAGMTAKDRPYHPRRDGDDGGLSSATEHGDDETIRGDDGSNARQRQTGEPDQTQNHQERQRRYKSRTCRICLEVVEPTTEIDDTGGRIFGSKVRVKYVSEDPELGRLLCPCKCKGSQKYVHEGCLRAWRQAAPLSDRNFWRCPTCHFEYRIERLAWGSWLSSRWTRAGLTLAIMLLTVFLLGFVADPIINMWVDPLSVIADTLSEVITDVDGLREEPLVMYPDEPVTWTYHFWKGLFSLGVLGFLKSFLAMSPWHWFNVRHGGGRRRAGTGRDRLETINWALVIIGVVTFLTVRIPPTLSFSLFLYMSTCPW